MIKIVETPAEKDKAYDLICQLHKTIAYPVLRREEYEQRLKMATEGGYVQYILLVESEVVGMIGFRIKDDLLGPRRLYIDDLVVDAGFRKRGCGTRLLNFSCEIARKNGCCSIDLAADLKNETAIKAYESYDMDKITYLMRKML